MLIAGLASVPLLWIGVPALARRSARGARAPRADPRRARAACERAARRPRPRLALHLGRWLLAAARRCARGSATGPRARAAARSPGSRCVVAMTAAGYSASARYMLPAAAIASRSPASARQRSKSACALHGPARPRPPSGPRSRCCARSRSRSAAGRVARLDDQVREGTDVGRVARGPARAIDAAGGSAALRRCALTAGSR